MLQKFSFYLLSIFFSLFLGACNQAKVAEAEDQGLSVLTTYHEPHRPQWHFSPDSMWMNDPNGMVYYEGEYHLFYQYYPDSTVWGPMHWGHAVSQDLVYWEHLPIALYPDSLGYIFSGCAVVDWNNTSGFGRGDRPPLVGIFTYHDPVGERQGTNDFQTQAIAYSLDKGRTWSKYQHNPVVANPGIRDFRDPKVFWHESSQHWIMIFAAYDHVKIFNSLDLKQWELVSEFGKEHGSHGGVWECPDLFPLSIDDGDQEKWIMIVSLGDGGPNGGSGTQYFIGDFDGTTFTNLNSREEILWLDYGRDNYAGVTWSDIPEDDGRRLFMGWMSNWRYAQLVPTERWRSAMTMPRALELRTTSEGLRVVSLPVTELHSISSHPVQLAAQTLGEGEALDIEAPYSIATSILDLTYSSQGRHNLAIELSNSTGERMLIGYDSDSRRFYIDRRQAGKSDFSEDFAGIHYAPRISPGEPVKMEIFLDVSSVELFADNGEVVMTSVMFPNENYQTLKILNQWGEVRILEGKLSQLGSVWDTI